MKELSQKIDELAGIIDLMIQYVIAEEYKESGKLVGEVSQRLAEIMPKIIETYADPLFEDVKDDMNYWVNQTRRILDALQQEDMFLLIDVLRFETLENLLLYQKMIDRVEENGQR